MVTALASHLGPVPTQTGFSPKTTVPLSPPLLSGGAKEAIGAARERLLKNGCDETQAGLRLGFN